MLLEARSVTVSLGDREVLKGVDFDVREGEIVGLIGPNGAGKSTLMRALHGLVAAGGEIAMGGRADMGPAQKALFAAYLPQEREIAWPISVEELVMLGRAPHVGLFAAPGREDREAVERAMAAASVTDFRKRAATELSGGERARVLLARALAQEAPLLLADEPAAGLDPAQQIALMRVFARLAAQGRGVAVSMHDLGLAARWCSRLVLLSGGRVAAQGRPEEVLTREILSRVYGVEVFFGEAEGALVVQPIALAAAAEDRP